MAILTGITGNYSGKAGGVTFRIRKGKTIATQYQPNVANPKTPAQQDARAAMRQSTLIMKGLAEYLSTYCRFGLTNETYTNRFSKQYIDMVNKKAVEENETREVIMASSSFMSAAAVNAPLVTAGTLSIPLTTASLASVGGVATVTATWSTVTSGDDADNDNLVATVVNVSTGQVKQFATKVLATRDDGTVTMSVTRPEAGALDVSFVYLSFRSSTSLTNFNSNSKIVAAVYGDVVTNVF